MLTLVFILFSCFTLINGSTATDEISHQSQSGWFLDLGNLPNLDWLSEKIRALSTPELNQKDESREKIQGYEQEKISSNQIFDVDQTSDEHKSSKKVDDILEIIDNSTNEEKKQFMPLLENLEKTLIHDPARYVKIFIKDVGHIVDLGVFKSGERRRNEQKVKSLWENIRDWVVELFHSIYNLIFDRVEAGRRGAQKGWAHFERKKEGDPRIWPEEKALERLTQLETEYKTLDKDVIAKDIISMCMQPLYKESTYGKIVMFLDKLVVMALEEEKIIEKAKLDKAFDYVNYKGQFAKEHHID